MTRRIWPEQWVTWSCHFRKGKDQEVNTWKRVLALNLFYFICSILKELGIGKMPISECRSKYSGCLMFESIRVCAVGLSFLLLAGLWSYAVLGSEQLCGRIPEERSRWARFCQWALPHRPQYSSCPARFCFPSEHDSLGPLPHSSTPLPAASYPPILGGPGFLPQVAFSRWDGVTDMAFVSQFWC